MGNNGMSEKRKETTGQVLKDLREETGMTAADAASQLGRTRSWLSMLEGGKSTTTLDSLIDLLCIYKCEDLSRFFELVEKKERTGEPQEHIAVTRATDWQPFTPVEGIIYELPPYRCKLDHAKLDITPATLRPGGKSGIIRHPGEEVIYVLEGRFKAVFYNDAGKIIKELLLEKGDAVHFYTSVRHEGINYSDTEEAKFLIVRSLRVFP